MYTTRLTPPKPFRTLVTAVGRSLQLGGSSQPITVTRITQGLRGTPGYAGEAQISSDPGNLLIQGSDQKLFVADPNYDFDGLMAATLSI